jgi:hypothetical protein
MFIDLLVSKYLKNVSIYRENSSGTVSKPSGEDSPPRLTYASASANTSSSFADVNWGFTGTSVPLIQAWKSIFYKISAACGPSKFS